MRAQPPSGPRESDKARCARSTASRPRPGSSSSLTGWGSPALPKRSPVAWFYGAFDVVVHCDMNPNNRLRWVGEVVAPLLEGGEPKIHHLWEPSRHAGDLRARASKVVWPALLTQKIRSYFPDFDEARARDDSYAPHTRVGVPDPSRNGHRVHA